MRVLGLSCGNPDGSAEILLKVALQAVEAEGAEVALEISRRAARYASFDWRLLRERPLASTPAG